MGSQKSQEANALIYNYQPNQFIVLQSNSEWQLWQDRISTRRYMVFHMENKEFSDHNMEIYHFRKLNRAYLPGVHAIYQKDTGICTTEDRALLMLDYLPFTLGHFRGNLSLQEGLTVLQAALAGYRIMSYLFGPLRTSIEMIRFNEGGVPKVWANQQIQKNVPSVIALEQDAIEDQYGRLDFPNLGIVEKRINSIRSIVETISSSLSQPFPRDFLRNFSRVRSYEEGEQIVEAFCRRQAIELQQWIQTKPSQEKKERLAIANESFVDKTSFDKPINQLNSFNNTLTIRNQRIEQHYQHPIQRIHPIQSVPLPQYSQYKQINHNLLKYQSPAIHLPQIHSVSQSKVTVQPVVTQTIITTSPIDSQQRMKELNRPPILKSANTSTDDKQTLGLPDSKEPVMRSRPKLEELKEPQKVILMEDRVKDEESSESAQRNGVHSSEQSQSSHEQYPEQQDNYQTLIQDVADTSQNNIQNSNKSIQMQKAESDHVATPDAIARQQIDLWQQSMHKLTKKITSRHSSDYYRSQERDQVILPDQHHPESIKKDITEIKSQEEIQRYIRNKYKDYFNQKQIKKKSSHQHTNSLDRQLYQKKVSFYDVPPQMDQQENSPIETARFDQKSSFNSLKKYTFGDIEPQSHNFYPHHKQKNQPSIKNIQPKQQKRRKKSDDDSINARYSKYVINRSKNIKQNQNLPSQFGRERKEDNSFEEMKRLLKE